MITATNVLVVLAMLVGTVGIVVPSCPGLFVVWAATLLWAVEMHSTAGWIVFGSPRSCMLLGLVDAVPRPRADG